LADQLQTIREMLAQDIMGLRLDRIPEGYHSVLEEAERFIDEQAEKLETALKADPAMSPEGRVQLVSAAAAAVDDYLQKQADALDAAGVDVSAPGLNGAVPSQDTDSVSLLADSNPGIIEAAADVVSAGNPHQSRDEEKDIKKPTRLTDGRFFSFGAF